MTTTQTTDLDQIAQEVGAHIAANGGGAAADAIRASIADADLTGYAVTGSLTSYLFYATLKVTITGGETFDGKSGGVGTPGSTDFTGTLYLTNGNSLQSLYANTQSFLLVPVTAGISITFFDGNSNSLATVAAVAASTIAGMFGGTGSWS